MRRGSKRWLPWLPETTAAATDDARGVTDSWQSYHALIHLYGYLRSPWNIVSTGTRFSLAVIQAYLLPGAHREIISPEYLLPVSIRVAKLVRNVEFHLSAVDRLIDVYKYVFIGRVVSGMIFPYVWDSSYFWTVTFDRKRNLANTFVSNDRVSTIRCIGEQSL